MPLTVPAIDDRDRIPEQVLAELIAQIAARFQPLRIILFGSYAYGKPVAESDVDLLVIMETSKRESRQALEIRQYIQPLFGLDILVITPARLEQRLKLGDWFLREITTKGRIVYESPDG
jgi:predicted nucleotidyltransferase